MLWIVLLVAIFAIALIKLGAASVMVNLLGIGLMIATIVIIILAALLLWKWYVKEKP